MPPKPAKRARKQESTEDQPGKSSRKSRVSMPRPNKSSGRLSVLHDGVCGGNDSDGELGDAALNIAKQRAKVAEQRLAELATGGESSDFNLKSVYYWLHHGAFTSLLTVRQMRDILLEGQRQDIGTGERLRDAESAAVSEMCGGKCRSEEGLEARIWQAVVRWWCRRRESWRRVQPRRRMGWTLLNEDAD